MSNMYLEEDNATLQRRTSRKRRIQFLSDEESDAIQINSGSESSNDEGITDGEDITDDEVEYRGTPTTSNYTYETQNYSDEIGISDEDDFPDDPFTRPSDVSRFIDDYADEDDQVETLPKPQKVDKITENINRARSLMETNDKNKTRNSNSISRDSESSDDDDDDDSDAPDYEFMSSPLKSNASSSTIKSTPTPSQALTTPPQPQTKEEASSSTTKTKSKDKHKKEKKTKKNKKNKSKRDKKKHRAHE